MANTDNMLNLTREQVAEQARISVNNIIRFEQKGLISLQNLIDLAIAMGYVSEIKNIFSKPKYQTMEELMEIRKNMKKKNRSARLTLQSG